MNEPTHAAEGQNLDRKSLRAVQGKTKNFSELAKDCVCFANGLGGRILIGIEDGDVHPAPDQRIDPSLIDHIAKRIIQLTVNVQAVPNLRKDDNGGEYIEICIPRSTSVASTRDGRYFLRIGDTCFPILGDDVMRLADERSLWQWEKMTSHGVPRSATDSEKLEKWVSGIQKSTRVKPSVKEKTDNELLDHYGLAKGEVLTNLGILLLGTMADRRRLGTAPVIQAIRYDAREEKIWKHVWGDHDLSPVELVDDVWKGVHDFRESYDVADGMRRKSIPAYDEKVVRELLINALIHRPYTQQGDIYLCLYPDRLEVVNPGRLPVGVTPKNILHKSRRRNPGLAEIFHALELTENEGSGVDMIFDRLLAGARKAPVVKDTGDSVHVSITRHILDPDIIELVADAHQIHQLTQRERIVFGLLAQTRTRSMADLAAQLGLLNPEELASWTGRLVELGLIEDFDDAEEVCHLGWPGHLRLTDLRISRIDRYRLRELILEDVSRHPDSTSLNIRRRLASGIPDLDFDRSLEAVVDQGLLVAEGEQRWPRYRLREAVAPEQQGRHSRHDQ